MSFPNGPAECIGNEKSTLSFNVSIILFLSMLLISGVYKKKLISLTTNDILEQIAKIEK